MGVIDRLKRLTGEESRSAQEEKKAALGELRARIDTIMQRRPVSGAPGSASPTPSGRQVSPAQALGGEEVQNAQGAFHFIRMSFKGAYGHQRIASLASLNMQALAVLARSPELREFSAHDALFLDTETTGLAGGTGTFPFLIGLGWFEADAFITCQLLARDYSEERAILHFLQETAAQKRFLVTFNGKAFDINLLGTRYVLSRMSDPLAAMPHLDLLNPSRKLLKHRTTNCRLVTLEAEVLGLTRVDDVPGWEIPGRYFDWLRTRNASLLDGICEHNRLDIVSMAALVKYLSDTLSTGSTETAIHPGDTLAAARLHYQRGNDGMACSLLEPVIHQHPGEHARQAKRQLSLISKRQNHWQTCQTLWEELVSEDPLDNFALIELAKFYEHRSKNILRAKTLVQQALSDPFLSPKERQSLNHRLARLESKYEQHVDE